MKRLDRSMPTNFNKFMEDYSINSDHPLLLPLISNEESKFLNDRISWQLKMNFAEINKFALPIYRLIESLKKILIVEL